MYICITNLQKSYTKFHSETNLKFTKENIKSGKIPKNIIGVYFFYDSSDRIIYIGKSIDIRSRIAQHLYNGKRRLISAIEYVKVQKLSSELEALLFESQEIKKNTPKFNRLLRKSKSHLYLHQTTNENGYHTYFTNYDKDNSIVDFLSKKKASNFINKLSEKYLLCDKLNQLEKADKFCFKYHLKLCYGACQNLESIVDYNKRFYDSLNDIYYMPNNCYVEFKLKDQTTYVNVVNHEVKSYGILNGKHYNIRYPSYDEIRILNTYSKKVKPTINLI